MKVKVFFFILLIAPAKILFAQSDREKPERLLLQLKKMPADTTRVATLIRLADAYIYMPATSSRSDTADLFLREAQHLNAIFKVNKFRDHIDLLLAQTKIDRNPRLDVRQLLVPIINRCRRTGDLTNECSGWQSLAFNLEDSEPSNSFSLSCYRQALLLARQLNDRESVSDDSRSIANIHFKQGHFNLAENELLQIAGPKQHASAKSMMYTADLLSAVYIKKGEYLHALVYALQAIREMRTADDSTYAANFYNRVSRIHKDLGNMTESLEWSKKAYSNVVVTKESITVIMMAKMAVADRLLALGRAKEALAFVSLDAQKFRSLTPEDQRPYLMQLGSCYQALKMYAIAEKIYLNLMGILTAHKDLFSNAAVAAACQHIGTFYLSINRQDIARRYLLEGLKHYQTAGSMKDLKDMLLLLFKAESAAGNYHSAMNYLQHSNRLKDSIFDAEKNKQIQELQISYNAEEKNKDINELQDVAKVQRLNLKSAEESRNWITAGSFLLLLIAGLLYWQSLIAKKNNRLIQKKNQTLQRFLKEKEWLLKEVHHRVKNNLHTLICLMESQAKYLKDDALKAIETSQNRIFAMSLIHQKLYRSDDVKTINMAEYIQELIFNLRRSFDIPDHVRFDTDIEPVFLNVSYAIPIGLIVNEAVTNAIKYAFPNGGYGCISVVLYQYEGEIVLTIADDGIGIPHMINEISGQSLGIELMKGLCQDISGEICFDTNNGTRIIVTYTPENNFDTEGYARADSAAPIYG